MGFNPKLAGLGLAEGGSLHRRHGLLQCCFTSWHLWMDGLRETWCSCNSACFHQYDVEIKPTVWLGSVRCTCCNMASTITVCLYAAASSCAQQRLCYTAMVSFSTLQKLLGTASAWQFSHMSFSVLTPDPYASGTWCLMGPGCCGGPLARLVSGSSAMCRFMFQLLTHVPAVHGALSIMVGLWLLASFVGSHAV
ncbi:hypothetical protein COO60DRAFT_1517174 [Scenedesmus sp. NREL 46B-D3]|nr:hypothetical protein COO60DRAFT_1517174 [Scenedesmus sp. NREL 46B-D3]